MASFYTATIPPLKALLSSGITIVTKASEWAKENSTTETDLLEAKLAADMLPLAFQFYVVYDASKRLVNRLRDETPEELSFKDFVSFEYTIEKFKAAQAALDTITEAEFNAAYDKTVTLNLGPLVSHQVPLSGLVSGYSLPNTYFHLTTAYAILRSKGVPLGKAEYLGSHLGPVLAASAAAKA